MGNDNSSQKKLANDVEVTWKKTSSCPYAPREGQACSSVGQKLFLFGGVTCKGIENDENRESNQLLVFDSATLSWTEIPELEGVPEPRSGCTLAAVGSKLYLFGGLSEFSGWLDDFYVFDTDKNIWSEISNSGGVRPTPRDKLTSVAVGDSIYFFGGFGPDPKNQDAQNDDEVIEDDGDDEYEDEEIQEAQETQNAASFTWFNDIYKYDTTADYWSRIIPQDIKKMPTPRAAHTMSLVERSLIVFGGRDSDGRQNDTWGYDIDKNTWEECNTQGYVPEPRSFHAAVSAGKRMVVCGGRGITNEHFGDFHIYDTEANQWLQPHIKDGATPPTMGMHSLCVVDSSLVLYGGTSHLDPVTNSCTEFYSDCYILSINDVLTGGFLPPTQKEEIQKIPGSTGSPAKKLVDLEQT